MKDDKDDYRDADEHKNRMEQSLQNKRFHIQKRAGPSLFKFSPEFADLQAFSTQKSYITQWVL
jgi:hypothetical protein